MDGSLPDPARTSHHVRPAVCASGDVAASGGERAAEESFRARGAVPSRCGDGRVAGRVQGQLAQGWGGDYDYGEEELVERRRGEA